MASLPSAADDHCFRIHCGRGQGGMAWPALCRKIRYYEDRHFTRRLLTRIGIAPLALEADASSGPAATVRSARTGTPLPSESEIERAPG